MSLVKDQTINDQNKLIELIQSQGWNITTLELKDIETNHSHHIHKVSLLNITSKFLEIISRQSNFG